MNAYVRAALPFGLLVALAWAAQPSPGEIDTVNRQAIGANDYTRFIENIFWPTDDVLAAKRVPKDLVEPDIQELQALLQRALKEEFRPSEQQLAAGVIAVEGLRNGADYLLLRYDTSKYHLQVEEGPALYILVTPKQEARVPLDKVSEYVKALAFALLNIPEKDEAGKEPLVAVSSADIGPSRCGPMTYQADFPPPRHWYSQIRWWSDGRHVLFLTSRRQGSLEDMSRFASRPRGPRLGLFEYKKAAEEKANP
jgi:hypothetical protein